MQHPQQLVTPFMNQCLITIRKRMYLDNCSEPFSIKNDLVNKVFTVSF